MSETLPSLRLPPSRTGAERLIHEFRAHGAQVPAWMMTAFCTPDAHETPFHAFIDIVRGAFHIAPADKAPAAGSELEEELGALKLDSHKNQALLLNLSRG